MSAALALDLRGYAPAYRTGGANHCPGCGRSHWLVGRSTAECAFCATAIPIADASRVNPACKAPVTRLKNPR